MTTFKKTRATLRKNSEVVLTPPLSMLALILAKSTGLLATLQASTGGDSRPACLCSLNSSRTFFHSSFPSAGSASVAEDEATEAAGLGGFDASEPPAVRSGRPDFRRRRGKRRPAASPPSESSVKTGELDRDEPFRPPPPPAAPDPAFPGVLTAAASAETSRRRLRRRFSGAGCWSAVSDGAVASSAGTAAVSLLSEILALRALAAPALSDGSSAANISASLALLVRLLDRPEVGVEAAEAGVASAGSAVASLSSRFGAAAATAAVSTSAGADDDASLFRFRRDDRLGVVAGDAAGEGVGVLAASTLLLSVLGVGGAMGFLMASPPAVVSSADAVGVGGVLLLSAISLLFSAAGLRNSGARRANIGGGGAGAV